MKSACAYCDTLFNAGDSTADTGTSRSGQAASTERGKQIFSEYGAACHIVSAKGNVPAATALRISPADLTTPALQNSGSRYRRNRTGKPAARATMSRPRMAASDPESRSAAHHCDGPGQNRCQIYRPHPHVQRESGTVSGAAVTPLCSGQEPVLYPPVLSETGLWRRVDAMRLFRNGIGTHLDFYNLVHGSLAPFHVPRRIRVVACPEAAAFPSSLRVVDPSLHRPGVVT